MGNMVISLIDDLELKEILNVAIRFELYQFGSSLGKENFNDIDLLLIYKNTDRNRQDEILILRKVIKKYLFERYQTDVDITVLSENEEKEKKFLEQINYIKVY
ncbi:nucleotidyltransferase [Streptococcus suis]|uniref:nucleotidyltransferase n=1 Tax=Streptococcus suis TaxID=1307 RepID=UPI000CF43E70|nr:nucleotidyltransferase [Streptococcus suis]MBL6439221.1 nucleotidyltransferase [Streptococcus suis]MCO8201412.1 nucleotidyltransferase [Streptococcus suis]MCO8218923.1 nucleotidyltransferase [Streptococcus suis]MCO8231709.1 nucleotidyltransferase [Streptococcus suis]HEM3459882.1 nucleotidyltransferase [Streptococcus suis]